MIDIKELCFKTNDIARKVGIFIKEQQSKIKSAIVEVKDIPNFVTYIDKTAEKMIIAELKLILSNAGFIAEEGPETYRAEQYNWIINPLDGITNYIHGLSPFAVSIALQEYDEIILGVVYEISLDECFYSWKGAPEAYLDGKTISVSKVKSVDSSLIATEFPYYDYYQLKAFMASLEYLIINSHNVRRSGSAPTDLAYVACGRFEAFYEYSLQAWNVAAGSFLVRQAGGKVCDLKKDNDYIFRKEIIASNALVHDGFRNIVNKYMIN